MNTLLTSPHKLSAQSRAQIGVQIETYGLEKAYGNLTVLRGIDLEIAPGEFLVAVGRSGSGKSTLLRLLAGLEAPTGGEARQEGRLLRGLNTEARVMFQDARLMPWMRVRENVGLGLNGKWSERVLAALAEVGLSDRAGDWPAILSGGQRQRVALARALAGDPRFLLLDEPLGALDALTRLEMQALVERLWRERQFTALLITHDVEEAVALADRIVLIEDGQITLNLPIPLARPRDRTAPEFLALREEVLRRVMHD